MVGNPEDRFSQNEAYIIFIKRVKSTVAQLGRVGLDSEKRIFSEKMRKGR